MTKKSINKSSANGSVQKNTRDTVKNSVRTARQNGVSKSKSVAATSVPRRPSLTSLSTKALAAELRRRRSQLPKLMKKAAKLQAALAKVMASIASLGGATGGLDVRSAAASVSALAKSQAISRVGARTKSSSSSAPRLRNGQPTIGEHLVEILRARAEAMSPNELAPILGKRLSREVTDNFRVQISLTLARLIKQGRVSKLGRAQYVARGVTIANID
ncbi:MAG: hypothetical protein RLY72_1496 [Planctomycetota bacterium]